MIFAGQPVGLLASPRSRRRSSARYFAVPESNRLNPSATYPLKPRTRSTIRLTVAATTSSM